MLVPSVTKNLINVSQFCKDKHVFFEFHHNRCVVKSHATNEILLHGSLGPDGLYVFPQLQTSQSAAQPSLSVFSMSPSTTTNKSVDPRFSIQNSKPSECVAPTSQTLWHLRLGHPNSNVLKKILTHCNIPISNKNLFEFCAACCVGKSHRLPSSSSQPIYFVPLELVYSDLWGPSNVVSTNGFSYYISFVDAFSKFTWIYFLKNKSETFTVFQQFKAMVELQFNTKLKSIQTDWGVNSYLCLHTVKIMVLFIGLFVLIHIIKMVLLRGSIDILLSWE